MSNDVMKIGFSVFASLRCSLLLLCGVCVAVAAGKALVKDENAESPHLDRPSDFYGPAKGGLAEYGQNVANVYGERNVCKLL